MKRKINKIRYNILLWILRHTQVGMAILMQQWLNGYAVGKKYNE